MIFFKHLQPNGTMLLTIGDKASVVPGKVASQQVHHSCLSPSEYRDILHTAGFAEITIALRDEDYGGHSLLLARGYTPPDPS